MFVNIAVVAPPGPALDLIRSGLRNPILHTVREFLCLEEVNQSLSGFSFDILIARYPQVDERSASSLQALHARFHRRALVVVSPQISPEIRYQFREMSKLIFVHEKFEVHDLPRIVEVVSKGSIHPARLHVRSSRQEAAKLLNSENGQKVSARLIDLAQMGARVLVPTPVNIQKNRRVQLQYPSRSEPGKIHRIEAKVVWVEVSAGLMSTFMTGPEQQLGLRFIAAL